MTNDASITIDARPPETLLGSRRPRVALTRNPANGSSGINASTVSSLVTQNSKSKTQTLPASPFERRKSVGIQRLAVSEERNDQREADRRLSRGHGHDEERDDLPVEVAGVAAEGDERQVHRVQHDLDRQKDRDQVLPQEHTGRADGKQRGRENQIVAQRNHCSPSRRANTTAPTIATRINIDVASNANVCRVKIDRPMA